MNQTTRAPIDPLIDQFLSAGTEDKRQEVVARLLAEHAYQRIDGILGARFRQSGLPVDQRDDIRSEILVRLINRLTQLVEDTETEPIASFPDYVAVVAFNTFDDFVRKAFPLRAKLKNRIRYTLTHDPRLALWLSGASFACGLHAWRGLPPEPVLPSAAPAHAKADIAATLLDVFHRAGAPIALQELVSLLSSVYHVPVSETPQHVDRQRVAMTRHPAHEIENRQYLRALWDEICELPVRQRIALLLHARDADGESVTRLLPASGVATMHQIGDSLSLQPSEFTSLWNELPLEDTKIAGMLQLSRQQVINLRRSARDRLERRMRARHQVRRKQ